MSFTIGFIGLGAMGSLMADNLLQAGHSLQVWNRTAARCTPLVERGAKACDNPAQAAQSADFVVSMVADDAATAEVMLGTGGVLETFRGQAIIDCSTNSPAMARRVAQAALAHHTAYLDAPVSGILAQARGRELVFMVGGAAQAVTAAMPLFEAMGRMVRHMGDAGSGATVKLINNMMSGTVNAAIAEAVSVAEAAGLDVMQVGELLAEGAAGCRLVKTKIPNIAARDFSPQFGQGFALLPGHGPGARSPGTSGQRRQAPDAVGAPGGTGHAGRQRRVCVPRWAEHGTKEVIR
ncbi:MAG: NAD(P)-dependent oxidoreductase [Burkholderiales bacterium]|nr:NAD(P)-dependent oxidoreductase [Burkholderiales bacterium]